tara:strand:+ start:328 stop:624 length:297 start_codon:yes stop_codon:yes gene_type:complete
LDSCKTSTNIDLKRWCLSGAAYFFWHARSQVDETGTLEKFKRMTSNLIEPTVSQNNGRIFKTMEDRFLAEFASAIDALNASVEIQNALSEENAKLPRE